MKPATSSFALAAAVAIVFNTLLAWAKDAWEPLNGFLKSIAGHHWTTHGLADLVVFAGLGFVLQQTRVTERMNPERITNILIAAVIASSLGLALWYVFF